MSTTTTPKPAFPPQPFWTAFVCLLTGLLLLQPSSAVTLYPTFDSRSLPNGPTNNNVQDLTVGPNNSTSNTNNYYRSYMTFDLSALTVSDTATNVTLKLFGYTSGGNENNNAALPQVFTLFQVSSDWNGTVAPPGVDGTALAAVNITPALGNDGQNIEFSGTNLMNAFNNAIGGTLYLGIKSDKETVTSRSFCNFQSSEDPSKPTLTAISANLPTITVSVPDGSAAEPGADTATFTLNRGSATNSAVTVFYTFSGTATNGSDYTESGAGSVTFAAGASNANVVITAVNDAVAERLETVILTVTANAAYNIGSPGTGTATITDDNDDNNDVLVRYIFTDASSTASTFSLAAQVYSTNVTATAIVPGAGIGVGNSSITVSPPNAGYIASTTTSSNQTEAIANDDYFSFTLTPTLGNSLTLTNLELSAVYSVTNPLAVKASLFVRSSLDGYASDVASNSFSFTSPYTTMSIPLGAAFTQVPSNLTFRVYVFDDTDTTQDGLRIDDIFVRGRIEVAVNHAPVATNLSFSVAQGDTGSLLVIGGKFPPTDADPADTNLTVTAVGPVSPGAAGTAGFTSSNVTFTAANDYSGTATFSYTVSDGRGGSDTKTVTVTISPASSGANLALPVFNPPGVATLHGLGIPGHTYQLQYTTSLNPVNWQDVTGPLATAAASVSNGTLSLVDTNAGGPGRFYRTRHVP